MSKPFLVKLGLILICTFPMVAFTAPGKFDYIEAELVAEATSIQPGSPFWVGLRLAPEEDWKTYWRNPGGSGLPTEVQWHLPQGITAGELQWPYPELMEFQGIVAYGYDGEVLLLTQMQPATDLDVGTDVPINATVSWMVCHETCIPGSADFTLVLPVKNTPPELDSQWASVFGAARNRLPKKVHEWQASFAVRDEHLHLEIQASEPVFSGAENVRFLPYEQDLIASNVLQERDWSSWRLYIKHELDYAFEAAPSMVDGVVLVEFADGERSAFSVSASPTLNLQADQTSGTAGAESPAAAGSLLYAVILALGGGLLLNLMPCVFPVLSLKAISLMETAQISHQAQRVHGIAYTLGVMVFFCAVAGVLYLLRTGGSNVGWGFQLQTPWFVALLAYLLFILGLSFSGLLELGGRFMGVGESLVNRGGYASSFFTGALAAVVASPCTAPFMGTAIAYAITQPPLHSLLVFMSMGFGMALPFLVVAFVPRFGQILPRPGPWMEVFKQVMAFPLYLTAVWLVWVLGRQTSMTGAAVVLIGMILLVFAVWLRHLKPQPKGRWRHVNATLAIASTAGAFAILAIPLLQVQVPEDETIQVAETSFWEPYSDSRLAELRAQGQPVFVNITADWCISCIANERVALSFPSVRQAFKEKNVVPLKGDWTNRNPELTQILEAFDRSGVPLYLLYPGGPNAEPKVLPQWLSPVNVMDALQAI